MQDSMGRDLVILNGYLYSHCLLLARILGDVSCRADILGIRRKDEAVSATANLCSICRIRQRDYSLAGSEYHPSMAQHKSAHVLQRAKKIKR